MLLSETTAFKISFFVFQTDDTSTSATLPVSVPAGGVEDPIQNRNAAAVNFYFPRENEQHAPAPESSSSLSGPGRTNLRAGGDGKKVAESSSSLSGLGRTNPRAGGDRKKVAGTGGDGNEVAGTGADGSEVAGTGADGNAVVG
jgi:hypothetical protein